LHWVEDQKAAASNMFQHLKAGGRLVVEFGGYGNVATIINALRSSLNSRGFYKNASLERWYFPSIASYTSLLEEVGFEVVLAQLYDRPTLLDSKNEGIKDWIEMFGSHFFQGINPVEKAAVLTDVQNSVRSICYKDGQWYADYRRLRVVAVKK
jgi:trans-aconitate methyltransferase